MSFDTTAQIHNAIKCSRYNEAVILTVDDGSSNEGENSGKREIVLVPSLDAENGGIVWNDAKTSSKSDFDQDIGIIRHLRTKRWVMPMLNDEVRNRLYDQSIRRACGKIAKKLKTCTLKGKEGTSTIRVLDIGSGTGLLAMVSASHLKLILIELALPVNVCVKSVEMAAAMARLSSKTITENNLGDTIEIVEGHSCDDSFKPFTAAMEKAQLCTSELLESGLLGEGLIPAMRDAWDRHLEKDAIVIPQKARVYAQAIECDWITNFRSKKMNWKSLRMSPKACGLEPLMNGNLVVPIHAEAIINDPNESMSMYNLGMAPCDTEPVQPAVFLSEPALVLEFDFTSKESIPPKNGRSVTKELTAINTGYAHAILFWWEIDLFDETYSTKMGGNWQDHWQQCIFVFSDTDCCSLTKGEAFLLVSKHNDSSITFEIDSGLKKSQKNEPKRQKTSHEIPNHISSDRALQLNDRERMEILVAAIKTALMIKGDVSNILDVSDFSLCSLIAAAEFNAKNVTSIESSSIENLGMLSALVAQVGNHLPRNKHVFQIVQAHLDTVTLDNLHQKEGFDLVMAEYFEIMQSWSIASAINYYFIILSLKGRKLIKADAISIPSFATIKCCAVEFHPNVVHAHCGLHTEDESICGLSHKDVCLYGKNFSKHDMKFSLWQYKWRRLSSDFTVAKLPYEGGEDSLSIEGDDEWCEIQFSRPGTCHCLAFWVDYGMRNNADERDSFQLMTTGNRHHQQTIRMLASPKKIFEKDVKSIKLLVKPRFKNRQRKDVEDYSFEIKSM